MVIDEDFAGLYVNVWSKAMYDYEILISAVTPFTSLTAIAIS